MRQGTAIGISSVLVPLGTALVTVGTQSPPPSVLASYQLAQPALLVAGIIVLALTVAILVVAFLPEKKSTQLDCEFARRSDLKMLYEFARDYFPTASLNQTKALYNLNNRMYWMVMSRQKRLFGLEFGSKLLGYFTVVPLAREAIPLLEGDEFGVQHFNKDYVSKKGGNVAAVYIGSIAARRRVGPHAISRLAFIIGEYRNDGVPVYTRPVTKTGMRLMSEWGFAPVREPGRNHIYKLDEQSAALFEIERAKRALDRTIRVDDLGGNPSREEVQHLTGESDST